MASAPTYDQIAWTSLGSATSTFTLSSIPQGYTDLRIVLNSLNSTTSSIVVVPNGTTNICSGRYLSGDGSSALSSSIQSGTYPGLYMTSNGSPSTTYPNLITIDIFNYSSTTVKKTVLSESSIDKNGSGLIEMSVQLINTTTAISSLVFQLQGSGNFNTGTTAALYGIKAA